MDRRRFLQLLGCAAMAQAIPKGRVWSFPSNVQIYSTIGQYADYVNFADLFYGQGIFPELEKMQREFTISQEINYEILYGQKIEAREADPLQTMLRSN